MICIYENQNAGHKFKVRKPHAMPGGMWWCEVVEPNPRFPLGEKLQLAESFLTHV